MINLDLTKTDEEILGIARRQAKTYRQYAKTHDRMMDYAPGYEAQFAIPGEENFIHLRQMAADRVEETSGLAIMHALLYMEEFYGGKSAYYRGPDADSLDVRLATRLIKYIGTPEQEARWGDAFLAWGMTEPGAGSDPASMRTTAVLDTATNEWVINGEKTFISHGETADGILVLCRCRTDKGDEGIAPIVVMKGTPGFAVSPQMAKLGLRNWDTVSLSFMDCRVPADHRLEGSLKQALSTFNTTRATIAAQALGFARIAIDFVRARLEEAGIEIDYASTGHLSRPAAVDRFMRLEALFEASFYTMLHAKWHEQARGQDKFYPALAKAKCGIAVRKIIGECMTILGPDSSSELYPLEQAIRDSRVLDIYEGPSEVQKLIMGRVLLGYNAAELN